MKIATERLVMRPYGSDDLQAYYKLLSDKDNLYYLGDIVVENLEEARLSLQEATHKMQKGEASRFAVTLDGKLIGGIGYDITDITPIGKIGHMGWFLMPEYHNKGYITEATRALLNYAFTQDNCIRITTGCYRENLPTQKVMEKVGFRKEAEKLKAAWHDGKMKDRLEFAINRKEWTHENNK